MNRFFLILLSCAITVAILGCASVESSASGREPAGNAPTGKIQLSESAKSAIGKKIWQNECGGTVSGLTSWNKGEDFPSLGIGHFIWYVEGRPGPFDESFPSLIKYMQRNGVAVPRWVAESKGSPWKTRTQFLGQQNSPQMKELRNFLASTVSHQTGFIIERLENSLPKMKGATANPADRQRLESNFYAVASSPAGTYALIDYVNFKGEGTKETERYNGQGWGLRDVLLEMRPSNGPANYEFAEAAKRTLSRRVQNSPSSRGESRWLNGWHNRCEGYKKGV